MQKKLPDGPTVTRRSALRHGGSQLIAAPKVVVAGLVFSCHFRFDFVFF